MLTQIRKGEADSSLFENAKRMFVLTDSLNLIEAKQIFEKYGYPAISMVGEKSSHKYWLLVQHCDEDLYFQVEVLAAMEKLLSLKECSITDFAYLTDRVRVNQGKEQIYGTQVELNKEGTAFIPKSLFKPNEVEKRRAEIGLYPLKDYLEWMARDFIKNK